MKSITSGFYLIVATFLIISLLSNFSCGKEDKTDTDNPDSETPDIIPDANTSYIAYYAESDGGSTGNPQMMVVSTATIGGFDISVAGDTTSFNLIFSNYNLKNHKNRTNSWNLCDSTYDEKGHDNFAISSVWIGGATGKLEAGKEYNCAGFRDGVKLSYETSWGYVFYSHINASGKQKYRSDIHLGGNGANVKDSYIKIDKIEDGKATGTFQLGFDAGCERPNGFPYANNVTGKFNKIPVK
ncbi:MAG: hypothetical protein QM768_03330 [Agriterribacter sp.]